MAEPIISFKKVTKKFYLQEERTFKEMIPRLLLGKAPGRFIKVFSDISFDINIGETVGIIGRNGAGKSTMLKLIAGVTSPTSGSVNILGKVTPLIEVGAGFHHELSGYENIFLHAAILGLHKKEIEQRVESIIEFSGLREYIHTPVKRYSTGMYMKLGFAIAVHTNTPILLIDEVLAVGDQEFQDKCLKLLKEIKKSKDKTIIFVSHNETAVKNFCDRAILINEGQILADEAPEKVFSHYHKLIESGESINVLS